ncbi:hypothetical protein EI534_18920 [Pseudomonas frederiksbergensis]|nr:hypothetical protein [Pseudomonas frederiksbergensis]
MQQTSPDEQSPGLFSIYNTTNPVGAGLLAKAMSQATLMTTDTPSSRASPLPQGPRGNCGKQYS